MALLAPFPERLTMISGDDNERVIEERVALQEREQSPDLCVGESNLANIRIVGVRAAIRFGRIVRPMRIVQVHPQKESRAADRAKPVERIGYNLIAAPLPDAVPAG